MDTAIVATLAILAGLGVGALSGYLVRRVFAGRRGEPAKQEDSRVLDDAGEQKLTC